MEAKVKKISEIKEKGEKNTNAHNLDKWGKMMKGKWREKEKKRDKIYTYSIHTLGSTEMAIYWQEYIFLLYSMIDCLFVSHFQRKNIVCLVLKMRKGNRKFTFIHLGRRKTQKKNQSLKSHFEHLQNIHFIEDGKKLSTTFLNSFWSFFGLKTSTALAIRLVDEKKVVDRSGLPYEIYTYIHCASICWLKKNNQL